MLPGDGLFGVRVRANGNGQSPQAGEAPDAWVEIDTTAPTVNLMPPIIGTGADAGTLTIQWQVQDRNLVPDSINIYQPARPDGPWQPIAVGLRNEGGYRWLIPAGIGSEIYLRLEASDRAGNVGRTELRNPVAIPQPKVRVIGIGRCALIGSFRCRRVVRIRVMLKKDSFRAEFVRIRRLMIEDPNSGKFGYNDPIQLRTLRPCSRARRTTTSCPR